MNRNDRDVLIELEYCHDRTEYPQEWVRPRDISGPVGSAQSTALRRLLAAGYVERQPKPHRANWHTTYVYRITQAGRDALATRLTSQLPATSAPVRGEVPG